MKLEPVYLLEPEPDTGVKLSRRSFVGVLCGAAAFGAAVGGWFIGELSKSDADAEDAARSENPKAAGAVLDKLEKRIDWARRIGAGEIDDLLGNARGYLVVLSEAGQDHELWLGAIRLAERVLHDELRVAAGEREVLDATLARTVFDYLDRLSPLPACRSRIEQLRTDLAAAIR